MEKPIDASSKDDVKLLASCFLTIPQEDKWKILAKLYDLNLMAFRGIRWALWLSKKIRGEAGPYMFFNILSEKSPKAIDNWIEDTIRHIVNGKDTTDSSIVGGWSQNEIDLLLDNVSFSLLRNRS